MFLFCPSPLMAFYFSHQKSQSPYRGLLSSTWAQPHDFFTHLLSLPSCSLYPSHIDLLAFLEYTKHIPKATPWHMLFSFHLSIHMACNLASLWSLLKCHLIRNFHDPLSPPHAKCLQVSSSLSALFIFIALITTCPIKNLFAWLVSARLH